MSVFLSQYRETGSRFLPDVVQTQTLGSLIPVSGAHLAMRGSKKLMTRLSGVFHIMRIAVGLSTIRQ